MLKSALDAAPHPLVTEVTIAGPGFINIRLNPAAKFSVVADALTQREKFGLGNARNGEKVLVEFVSANPTGPLHTGHARQAALGDTLCNLLETQGCAVHREFYYNDAGNQIDNLTRSVQLRASGVEPGAEGWPEDGYRGDYIVEIGKQFVAAGGDVKDADAVRAFAGENPDRSVYYPDDDQYLLDMEPLVRHYEVVGELSDPAALVAAIDKSGP